MRVKRRRAVALEQLEPRLALSNFYVAPTGSDSADGTITAPWRTPQHAASSVAAGDVINLRAGTYSGTVTIDKPDVTVQSYPGERAAIVAPTNDTTQANVLWFYSTGGRAVNLDVSGGYYYGIKYEFSGGLVDGCKVTGTGYYGIKTVAGVNDVTVRNTEIGNTGQNMAGGGFDAVAGNHITVKGCYIHDVKAEGIVIKGGSAGALIERNRIKNSAYAGILIGQATAEQYFDPVTNPNYYENIDAVVRNNIVENTDNAGIGMYAALSPQVYNNTLINTAQTVGASIIVAAQTHYTSTGALVTSTTDPSIVNNVVTRTAPGSRPLFHIQSQGLAGTLTLDHNRYNNGGGTAAFWDERTATGWYGTWSDWPAHMGAEAGSSLGDPGLTADGHLAAGSAIIGAGRTLAMVTDDFDGNPRSGTYDIGADQSVGIARALAGWTTVAGDWSQSGGLLSQTGLGSGDPKKADAAAAPLPAAAQVSALVRVDSWFGTDAARAGVSLGDDAAGAGYNLLFHRDTNTVGFLIDHVAWGNSYAFAWQPGVWYHFTLRQDGGVLLGKVWADGQAEPASWMFRQDGWAPRAGAAGLNGGADAGGTTSFNNFAASAVTAVAPSAPTGLAATGSQPGGIALSWVNPTGADSTMIERSPDGLSGWAQVGSAPTGVTTWQDSGLASATTYYYRTRASSTAGTSPYSNTASASTPSASGLISDGFDGPGPGSTWTTVAGVWSQSGGLLSQTGLGSGDPKKADAAAAPLPAAAQVSALVRVDSWFGTDAARAGVSLGDDAAGNGYNLLFHRDTNTVQFLIDHVAWGNSYAFAWQPGVWYHFTLRQDGGVLLGKVWADGQAEPASWMFRQDGWAPRAGAAGLNGGSDAGATASFDTFTATSV